LLCSTRRWLLVVRALIFFKIIVLLQWGTRSIILINPKTREKVEKI
jgi:hypothetical protein